MFKKRSLFTALIAIIFSIVILPHGTAFADIADGTYQINYEMKEAGSESTSIADGYFTSPAKLTVENGVNTVQITLTGAEMIKSLSAPSGPVTVISDNGDTRVVQFTVDNLSQPVSMKMHIVVPDSEAMPGGYDMEHTARAVFDVSGLDKAGASSGGNDSNGTAESTEKAEDNPPTGDNSQIGLYAMLLVGSAIAFFAVRKLRPARHS